MPLRTDIINSAKNLGCCAIIATYNNSGTLKNVISDVSDYLPDIFVVNDGSTDETGEILSSISDIKVVSYSKNRGKGYALRQGFKVASKAGFRYAITIDSDGQHLAKHIPLFIEKIIQYPDSLIVGSRILVQENMPGGNTFANKFSNFWFRMQTGINLPDTQSGFRLYPLKLISGMHFVTNRYEAELEMLVRSAWNGFNLISILVEAYYPPLDQRISHFRPIKDFMRISVLNTIFTILAFIYAYPRKLMVKIFKRRKY
jgi:glycosyltransferase involved in cell wall biosynthesis